MKNYNKIQVMTYFFIFILIFSWGVCARNITGDETFDNLTIKTGEKWVVTSGGNTTLKVKGNFIIESGGTLTYDKGKLKNRDVNLIINVEGDARIDGDIDLTGVKGSKGATGSGTYSSGVGKPGGVGGRGSNGKDITINVADGNLIISGTITTKGGQGGKGGKGAKGENGEWAEYEYNWYYERWVRTSYATDGKDGGTGGRGGTGGTAGQINFKSRYLQINRTAYISSKGGDRGDRGAGGPGGDKGIDYEIDPWEQYTEDGDPGGSGALGSKGQPKPAIINVGYADINGSIEPNTTINRDTSSPGRPVVSLEGIQDYYINTSYPVVSWAQVNDNGDPASGIKEYIIEVDNLQKTTVAATNESEYNITVSTALGDGNHSLTVTAKDNAGQTTKSYPESFVVDTIQPETPTLTVTDLQSNKVAVQWTDSSDTNGIASYIVSYTVEGVSTEKNIDPDYNSFTLDTQPNQKIDIKIKALDKAGNESNWSNIENVTTPPNLAKILDITTNGTYGSYYANVEVEAVEGENIEYQVLRKDAGTDTYNIISDWFSITGDKYIYTDTMGDISTKPHASYEYAVKIKSPISGEGPLNPYPDKVVMSNNAPQLINLISPADNSLFNKKYMIENEEINFEIQYKDNDNDTLNYKFVLEKYDTTTENYETIDIREYSASNQYNFTTSNLGSGNYRWGVVVNDGYENTVNKFNFVVDKVAPDRPKFNLNESNVSCSGSFGIDDNILYVSDTELTFKDILVSSDVENLKIYESNELVGNGESGNDISLNLINNEGRKELTITALDKAGNESQPFFVTVVYDQQIPDSINMVEYQGGENSLKVTWNEALDNGDSGIAHYLLAYKRVNQGQVDYIQKEIAADNDSSVLTNLDYNEPVEVKIKVVDKAGNESTWFNNGDYGYSLAEKATTASTNFDYIKQTDGSFKHYAHLKVNPVTARDMKIRYQRISETNTPIISTEWNTDTSVENLIDLEVEPHGEYKYWLVTRNNTGEVTKTDELYFEVPNNKPEQPIIAIDNYKYINQVPVIIETEPSIDPDMIDKLDYLFTLVDNEGNKIIDRVKSNLLETELDNQLAYKLTTNELTEGKSYKWWVEVSDGYSYVKSKTANSLVDLTPPTITFLTEETNDYYQQLLVKVDVNDSVSGISQVEYYWNNNQDEKQVLHLSENETLTFEAPQGRNILNIRSKDKAGNFTEWKSSYFIVDKTPPQVDNFIIDGQEIGGSYYTKNNISINWEVIEDSAIDYYRYTVITEDELSNPELIPDERFTKVNVNSSQKNFIQTINTSLEKNKKYFVVLEVINKSGLSSGMLVSNKGVIVDSTSPVIDEFELQGVFTDSDKNYLNNMSNLDLNINIIDSGSGLSDVSYAFTNNLNKITWYKTLNEALNSVETYDGQSYYLAVKAIDLVGNSSQIYSNAIIYDQTGPVIEKLIAGNSLEIKNRDDIYKTSAEQGIPISLEIIDESPLKNVSYAIGTSKGAKDISQKIYPDSNGWITTNNSSYIQEFEVKENLSEGIYYITIKAENNVGLITEHSSNPVQVNNSLKPVPVITDDGLYTTEDDRLHFTWTFAESDVSDFEYQIITEDEVIVRDWQQINTLTYNYYANNLNLENGQKNFIKIRAVDVNNEYSRIGYSNGIKVDTTFPQNLNIEDGSYSNGSDLLLKWGATDSQSGISKYEIKIGTTPGAGEVTDGWRVVDGSGETLFKGLSLEHKQVYYTTLRVSNRAGLINSTVSDGFIVDKTSAPEPIVLDEGKYTNKLSLKFDWKWSDKDPESGIKEYQYALLTSKRMPEKNEWVKTGLNQEITIEEGLVDGLEYYLAVKAINGAGTETITYSDGILIDTTAPKPPVVLHVSNYQSYRNKLDASFTVEDIQSGIDHCEYYLGTLNNKEAIHLTENIDENIDITNIDTGQIINGEVTIDGLNLQLGEIYFLTVKAINKAGLVSSEGISQGVKIIQNDLEVFDLTDYGEYSHFPNKISVAWKSKATYLPADYYQVAVSNTRYAADLAWFKTTTNSVLITPDMVPLDLQDGDRFVDGETYYVHVKAVDTTGYESDTAITDGIKLDSTSPTKPEVIYGDTHTTNQYKLKWASTEDDSRIALYRYAIGTVRGDSDVSGGWKYIETESNLYEDILTLNLVHNQTYYLAVQAKNITGLWSDIGYDKGRIADLTPPVRPEISYSGNEDYAGYYITNKSKIEDITYSSKDLETGISAYRYQIVKDKKNLVWEEIEEYEVNADEFTFNIENLSLSETDQYYIAVQTKNRLGVWSETGFSRELTVDSTAPTLVLENQDIELVTNNGTKEIPWNVSEIADVYYRIHKPDGSYNPISGYDSVTAEPNKEYLYDFNEDSSLEGMYELEIYAVDSAGNKGAMVTQKIRINAKPVIDLGNNLTQYKGRPITLSAITEDKDGQIEHYIWDFGDGSDQSNEISPEHSYTKLDQYSITLTCIDNDGGKSSASILIDITNTREGKLAMDETWSEEMNIIDTVIVPEGKTLTIEEGTQVVFPEETSLLVLGNLIVNGSLEQKVIFKEETGKWNGIKAYGTMTMVNINQAVIKNAKRGITLDSINGIVEGYLDGVSLENNLVGIHLVNTSPTIKECQITNNSLFGIKEDGECQPTLINNIFTNNLAGDYYDSILTELSSEELEVINND